MKYSLDSGVADYGFNFYEKIHKPIFLVNKLGEISRMNECGRKLLNIARMAQHDLERIMAESFVASIKNHEGSYFRIRFPNSKFRLIARELMDTNYVLVEVTK